MELVERATLIHPDGRTHRLERVRAAPDGRVRFHVTRAPDWEQSGMEVVAARDDGSVVCAFTVDELDRVVLNETKYPGQCMRVYCG